MSDRLLPVLAALALVGVSSSAVTAQTQRPSPAQSPAADSDTPSLARQQKQFPVGMQWTLVSLNGKSVSDNRPTMMIDDALRARGFAGCNTFSATAYPLAQQRFAVGPIALTRRSCEKGVMDLEKSFLVLFRTGAVWDLKDGQLVIQGNNGQLKFDRAL